MTPSQAVFRHALYVVGQIIDTYDHLPDGNVKYPFAYIGESMNTKTMNNDLLGTTLQSIHLYGTLSQRRQLDNYSKLIHDRLMTQQPHLNYHLKVTNYMQRNLQDNSTAQPLIHIVIDVDFLYTKKER